MEKEYDFIRRNDDKDLHPTADKDYFNVADAEGCMTI